jgi:preprotein translocase subunit SecE
MADDCSWQGQHEVPDQHGLEGRQPATTWGDRVCAYLEDVRQVITALRRLVITLTLFVVAVVALITAISTGLS